MRSLGHFASNRRGRAPWLSAVSACLVCLVFCLVSCGGQAGETDLLAYQTENFTAALRGEASGVAFEATLTHTAATETVPDTLTLTFTAPAALAGITLTATPDTATLSLDNMTVDASGWVDNALFDLIDLFALHGEPQSITADRAATTTATYLTENGTPVTLTLNAATATPVRIESPTVWVEVGAFEGT